MSVFPNIELFDRLAIAEVRWTRTQIQTVSGPARNHYYLMLTIACVYNSQINTKKSRYNEDWVDKLYRAVSRNIDIPFKFVCLSNVTTKYDTLALNLTNNFFSAASLLGNLK